MSVITTSLGVIGTVSTSLQEYRLLDIYNESLQEEQQTDARE